MNILDIIIGIPLLVFIYKGFSKGLIHEITTLGGILAGTFLAIHFSEWVAELLPIEGEYTILIAFLVTFLATLVGAYFLGKCIEGLLKLTNLSFLNKIGGAVFGMLKGTCVIAILLNFVLIIDSHTKIIPPTVQEQSMLFEPTHSIGNRITQSLKEYVEIKRNEENSSQQENA